MGSWITGSTLTLCALLWAQPALACKCRLPPAPADARRNAVAVFEGRVLEVAAQGSDGTTLQVSMAVTRSFKGPAGETVSVRTPSAGPACGYEFRKGERYLVYADGKGSALRVSRCSRTRPLAEARADLEQLGMGVVTFDPGTTPDANKQSEPAPAASADCHLATARTPPPLTGMAALSVLVVARTRRRTRR